jgi:hypothetical protein
MYRARGNFVNPKFLFFCFPGHVGLRKELVTLEEIFFEGGEMGLEGVDELEDSLGGSLIKS